ncbi:MAG: hypothetical protein JSV69_15730 [Chloroflexota bacterium]|nr:MAG: hypothetical protein JSV69_15730 [Chloroflexota bacterium]
MSRDKFNISSLKVEEHHHLSVRNTFIQQAEPGDGIALMYPGLRYSCDKPLLHYTTEVLLDQGFDVLQLWADYDNPEFRGASQAERTVQLIEDGKTLLKAGIKANSYTNLILVGKSLGTLTMAFILSEKLETPKLKTVWFTPLFNLPPVTNIFMELNEPAYVAGSKADPTFDDSTISQLQAKSNILLQVYEDADHSLEVPGNPLQSTRILTSLMAELIAFLS